LFEIHRLNSSEWIGKVIKSVEWVDMWKNVAVTCFEVLFRHFTAYSEQRHENVRIAANLSKIRTKNLLNIKGSDDGA
jgi:hypothetical protein